MDSIDTQYADPLSQIVSTPSLFARSPADWALVVAFGAIQWPWLLKSLSGGSAKHRHRLLSRLGLPDSALPSFGGWRADCGFLTMIVDHILAARPHSIVEFGGGASTLIIARAMQIAGRGEFLSFESDPAFAAQIADQLQQWQLTAELRHAPLTAHVDGSGPWYDSDNLPATIDLLVLDGPPWTQHPLARGNAECLFHRIAPGGVVMLDDAARPGERMVARRWIRNWPDFRFEFVPGIKGTLIGRRIGPRAI